MFFKPRYKFGEITKRWGDANFKKEFDTILDNWLKQFNEEDIPVLLELLKTSITTPRLRLTKRLLSCMKSS